MAEFLPLKVTVTETERPTSVKRKSRSQKAGMATLANIYRFHLDYKRTGKFLRE